MPIRINDATLLNQFQDTVPRAAAMHEDYLRAVARGVQEAEPPVSMALDEIVSGGFKVERQQCLVVEPTEPRLRAFKTVHYARPTGGLLTVGWYLVGGKKAAGFGPMGIGAANDVDADRVNSIVEIVHNYAVMPALQTLVDRLRHGNGAGGFAGV